MPKNLCLLILVLVFACNSNDNDKASLLKHPPFESVTDSISKDPQNAALYYRRGSLLYQHNHKIMARQDLRTAWELAPSEAYGLSLTTVLKELSTDSAIVFLEQAVQKLPESIALQIGLARGYQQKGEFDKSNNIADKILEKYPGQLDALSLKSEIYSKQDKTEESLQYLERAYSLVPSDPELAHDLAYEYAVNKNSKALKLTDSLIRSKAPEPEKAWYSRGVYYAQSGNVPEALKSFDAAITANYNFADAYLDKGELLFTQKRFDEAQKNFERALRVAPANALFFYWLGKCQEARGYKQEARANYQRAFGLDKSLTEARDAASKL